jgi:hypothetical protein
VVSEEARKAGGAAAEVAAVPKPGKEDALVARLDVTAPKTGGAVVTACSKAPNPVVEIAAVSEEARKAGVRQQRWRRCRNPRRRTYSWQPVEFRS